MTFRLSAIAHSSQQRKCYSCSNLTFIDMYQMGPDNARCPGCISISKYEYEYYIDTYWEGTGWIYYRVEIMDKETAESELAYYNAPDNVKATIRDHIYLQKL